MAHAKSQGMRHKKCLKLEIPNSEMHKLTLSKSFVAIVLHSSFRWDSCQIMFHGSARPATRGPRRRT